LLIKLYICHFHLLFDLAILLFELLDALAQSGDQRVF
jgi:hypothetical protein